MEGWQWFLLCFIFGVIAGILWHVSRILNEIYKEQLMIHLELSVANNTFKCILDATTDIRISTVSDTNH